MVERNHGHIINIGSTAGAGRMPVVTFTVRRKRLFVSLPESAYGPAWYGGARHRHRTGLVGGTEFSNVRFKGDDGKAKKPIKIPLH